jgi:hypothetical protein
VWPRAACERRAAGVGKVGSPLLGYDFFYFFFSFSKNKWTSQKKLEKYTYGAAPPQRQEFLPPSGTVVGVPPTVG